MVEPFDIYTDRRRIAGIIGVHGLFLGMLIMLLISPSVQVILKVIVLGLLALDCAIITQYIKRCKIRTLNYRFTNTGVTDYTQDPQGIVMPWGSVVRAEQVSDNAEYQIVISGLSDVGEMHVVVIDRFHVRWSVFSKVWHLIEAESGTHEFAIVTPRSRKLKVKKEV